MQNTKQELEKIKNVLSNPIYRNFIENQKVDVAALMFCNSRCFCEEVGIKYSKIDYKLVKIGISEVLLG